MSMRLVLLIDDRTCGLAQVRAAVPAALRDEVRVEHLDTFAAYRARGRPRAEVVLLDYYLDLEGLRGDEVAAEVRAAHLVGFSSEPHCSRLIIAAARAAACADAPLLHAVRKLPDHDHNAALAELFARILAP